MQINQRAKQRLPAQYPLHTRVRNKHHQAPQHLIAGLGRLPDFNSQSLCLSLRRQCSPWDYWEIQQYKSFADPAGVERL